MVTCHNMHNALEDSSSLSGNEISKLDSSAICGDDVATVEDGMQTQVAKYYTAAKRCALPGYAATQRPAKTSSKAWGVCCAGHLCYYP